MLDGEIADAATVPPSSKVHLSRRRTKDALKRRELAGGLAQLAQVVDGDTKFSSWMIRNPRAAMFGFRRGMVRWSPFGKNERQKASPEARSALEALAKSTESVDKAVTESSKVAGVLAVVDAKLLSPTYLRKSPFVRLELKSFSAESSLLSDSHVMALLLLHRSGTALLTFHTVTGDRNTDELLEASKGGLVEFDSCIFDEAIIGSEAGGRSVISLHGEEGGRIAMSDVFSLYREAIERVLGDKEKVGDWFCYTTVMAGGINCCRTRSRWLKAHSKELAGLAMRYSPYVRLQGEAVASVLETNMSISVEDSRFYFGGNALIVDWDFDMRGPCVSFPRVVDTVSVIENALLQHWQITALDEALKIRGTSRRSLRRTQAELARGIEEFGTTTLSYGTAQEISEKILQDLHTARLHQHLIERLTMTQQLLDTEQARQSTRRNYLLAGMGSLATVLLGIPALRDSLGVVAAWRPPKMLEPVAGPVVDWAGDGASAILSVYAVLLSVALLLLIAGFLLRKPNGRRRDRRARVGIEWTPFSPSWRSKSTRYVGGQPVPEGNEENGTSGQRRSGRRRG
ncbi:hypothetical protein [Micromonospora oryzae]|uniref:hypothetical protein n=1 Tax=Micromonospora sp. DSM 102119 TaxID=3111768 RepID=UPI0031E1D9E8